MDIQQMTLEEKIGQLVMVGIDGLELDSPTISMLEDYHVGGFILFKRNVESQGQALDLVGSLNKANKSPIPLLISIDEEGGAGQPVAQGVSPNAGLYGSRGQWG